MRRSGRHGRRTVPVHVLHEVAAVGAAVAAAAAAAAAVAAAVSAGNGAATAAEAAAVVAEAVHRPLFVVRVQRRDVRRLRRRG